MNEWKPYPENKPQWSGRYIVTMGLYVTECRYEEFTKRRDSEGNKYYGEGWVDSECGGFYENVIAFMNLPEPYKEVKNE